MLLLHDLASSGPLQMSVAVAVPALASGAVVAVAGVWMRARQGRAAMAIVLAVLISASALGTRLLYRDSDLWILIALGGLVAGGVIDWRLSRREQVSARREMAIALGAFGMGVVVPVVVLVLATMIVFALAQG